jgi:hypothetical protein
MRFSIFVTGFAFISAIQSAAGQQGTPMPLRQLEKEMMARISERAKANGGFQFGAVSADAWVCYACFMRMPSVSQKIQVKVVRMAIVIGNHSAMIEKRE